MPTKLKKTDSSWQILIFPSYRFTASNASSCCFVRSFSPFRHTAATPLHLLASSPRHSPRFFYYSSTSSSYPLSLSLSLSLQINNAISLSLCLALSLEVRRSMRKQDLDYVLVPLGLAVMTAYHSWLLHRIVKQPTRTVIGINAINRRVWVLAMMEVTPSLFNDPAKNGVLAVQTLRNNIMASTLLASTAIMLSSLIAVLMTSGGIGGIRGQKLVLGDTSEVGLSIKFFAILVCFLLAFLLNVQSIRYYSHASILINVPARGPARSTAADYVCKALNRGSYFWSLGLRAFYFSFPLFLWVFGPIPMFSSSLVLVFLLYFLDMHSGWGEGTGDDGEEKEKMGVWSDGGLVGEDEEC